MCRDKVPIIVDTLPCGWNDSVGVYLKQYKKGLFLLSFCFSFFLAGQRKQFSSEREAVFCPWPSSGWEKRLITIPPTVKGKKLKEKGLMMNFFFFGSFSNHLMTIDLRKLLQRDTQTDRHKKSILWFSPCLVVWLGRLQDEGEIFYLPFLEDWVEKEQWKKKFSFVKVDCDIFTFKESSWTNGSNLHKSPALTLFQWEIQLQCPPLKPLDKPDFRL